jgi:hypothetical protein
MDPCTLALNAAHYNELLHAFDAVMASEEFAGICEEMPLPITDDQGQFSGRMERMTWYIPACSMPCE